MLGSSISTASPNSLTSASAVDVTDDVLFTAGDDSDIAYLLRSGSLNANTALSGVLIGTPVTPALTANSLIIANATADGDILIAGNDGGHSRTALFFDASAPDTYLYNVGGTWTAGATTWTIPAVTLGGAVACGDQAFTGVGDMTFTNGSVLGTGTTSSDKLYIDAYDNNDTTYRHVFTITAGNNPTLSIGSAGMDTITVEGVTLRGNRGADTTCVGVLDDGLYGIGTGGDFGMLYETADADAKVLKNIAFLSYDSPNNVPVWFFGDETYATAALGSTAGFDFSGVTEPRIVLGDADGDSNVQFGFIADDRAFIGCGGTGTLIELIDTQGFATGLSADDYFTLAAYDSTGGTRSGMEGMRIQNNTETTCKLGFYGAAPVARAAHISNASGDDATPVNAILVVLENLGLVASS